MTIVVPCKMTVRIAVCLLHQQGCACRKRAVESSTRDGICHLLQLGRGSRLDIGMGQPGGCLPCGLCKCRTQLVQLFHGITHAAKDLHSRYSRHGCLAKQRLRRPNEEHDSSSQAFPALSRTMNDQAQHAQTQCPAASCWFEVALDLAGATRPAIGQAEYIAHG